MNSQYLKKVNLPDAPGVYFFNLGKKVLYIGRATSLRNRVKSYFLPDLINTRGPLIVDMVKQAKNIKFEKTDSVLEAIILEANEIKKYQPIFNTKEKDNKSFNYVIITEEDFPRILIIRGRELLQDEKKYLVKKTFGPFPSGTMLRDALKIVRKIFPFRDKCFPGVNKPCFNRQINLCPGICTGEIDKKEYAKTIKHISLFFEGKKKVLLKNLEKEMSIFAKQKQFEKANQIKKKIFALNHIQDVALMKNEMDSVGGDITDKSFRIEAYDIAHFSGKEVVGVMVVLENGQLKKNDYRKFKIRGEIGSGKNDDVGNLKELLIRRLKHLEWSLPDLIVIDGGKSQINVACEIFKEKKLKIDIVSVVKNESHKPREILGGLNVIKQFEKDIFLANSEAHRFAIAYHKKLRSKFI